MPEQPPDWRTGWWSVVPTTQEIEQALANKPHRNIVPPKNPSRTVYGAKKGTADYAIWVLDRNISKK